MTFDELVKSMSDEMLICDLKATYYMVNIVECFNNKDVLWLEVVADELEQRGYEIITTVTAKKVEEDSDEPTTLRN